MLSVSDKNASSVDLFFWNTIWSEYRMLCLLMKLINQEYIKCSDILLKIKVSRINLNKRQKQYNLNYL